MALVKKTIEKKSSKSAKEAEKQKSKKEREMAEKRKMEKEKKRKEDKAAKQASKQKSKKKLEKQKKQKEKAKVKKTACEKETKLEEKQGQKKEKAQAKDKEKQTKDKSLADAEKSKKCETEKRAQEPKQSENVEKSKPEEPKESKHVEKSLQGPNQSKNVEQSRPEEPKESKVEQSNPSDAEGQEKKRRKMEEVADLPALQLCFSPTSPSSGFGTPYPNYDIIAHWKAEAAREGRSLEEHMEIASRAAMDKAVEEHMLNLAKANEEQTDAKNENKEQAAKEVVKAEREADEPSSAEEEEQEEEEQQDSEVEEGDEEINLASESTEGSSDAEESCEESDAEELQEENEKEAEKVVNALVPHEKQSQIEDAVKKTPDFSAANSVSHKVEWDKFSRQCINKKLFPASLASHYLKDKLDLFRVWLTESQDWSNVEVAFERRTEKKTTSTKQRAGTKHRDLVTIYGKDKADDLCQRLRAAGMYYADPDFPKDEDEIYFYANQGNILREKNSVVEGATVTVKEKGNEKLAEAMMQEGGVLASGVMPEVAAATEKGTKAVLEAIAGGSAVKPPKVPKKKETTEEEKPETILEWGAHSLQL